MGVPYVFTETSPDLTLPKGSIKKLIMISCFRRVAVALFFLLDQGRPSRGCGPKFHQCMSYNLIPTLFCFSLEKSLSSVRALLTEYVFEP